MSKTSTRDSHYQGAYIHNRSNLYVKEISILISIMQTNKIG